MIRAADDFESIKAGLQKLAYNRIRQGRPCLMKTTHSSSGCWCREAGPGGSTLACPTEEDPLGIEKEIIIGPFLVDYTVSRIETALWFVEVHRTIRKGDSLIISASDLIIKVN